MVRLVHPRLERPLDDLVGSTVMAQTPVPRQDLKASAVDLVKPGSAAGHKWRESGKSARISYSHDADDGAPT